MMALVLQDVTVIELDRDDRLLRAEEGREDDRLSFLCVESGSPQSVAASAADDDADGTELFEGLCN